jgi:hypothetical protein
MLTGLSVSTSRCCCAGGGGGAAAAPAAPRVALGAAVVSVSVSVNS